MGLVTNVVVTLVTVPVGAFFVLVGLGYLLRYVRLKRSDPVDVRLLDDQTGAVEIVGTARVHEETSRPPLTRSESLLHRWSVDEYRRRPNASNWSRRDSGSAEHPFRLEDDTGTALVDPEGASVELQNSTEIEVDADESPPPEIAEYVEDNDDLEPGRRRRFSESRLEPGDDVHVLGPVRETGHSVDLPGGVNAVVGIEDPEDRGITLGEASLSDIAEAIRSDDDRFAVTNTGAAGAARRSLKRAVLFSAFGVVFGTIPSLVVWVL